MNFFNNFFFKNPKNDPYWGNFMRGNRLRSFPKLENASLTLIQESKCYISGASCSALHISRHEACRMIRNYDAVDSYEFFEKYGHSIAVIIKQLKIITKVILFNVSFQDAYGTSIREIFRKFFFIIWNCPL
jgi:hypothetical protein